MLAVRSSEEESTETEEMDTSEPNWCWFYLAECGVWHMFEVVRTTRHFTAVLTPDIFSPPAPEFVVVAVWHVGHLPVLLLFLLLLHWCLVQ